MGAPSPTAKLFCPLGLKNLVASGALANSRSACKQDFRLAPLREWAHLYTERALRRKLNFSSSSTIFNRGGCSRQFIAIKLDARYCAAVRDRLLAEAA